MFLARKTSNCSKITHKLNIRNTVTYNALSDSKDLNNYSNSKKQRITVIYLVLISLAKDNGKEDVNDVLGAIYSLHL